MSLKNMTAEEVEFWAKGCSDALEEVEKNGLWICPECKHLMGDPPKDYNICPHCRKEFGYDAPFYPLAEPIWKPSEK
jgi:rubrerythrin